MTYQRKTAALVFVTSFIVAGCQTSYQPKGFSGGFEEIKLSEDTYRISVQGNGYTSKSRTEEISLLRAAELTIQNGFSRFIVVGGAGVAQEYLGTTDIQVNRIGNSLIATGGDAITKPSGNIVIRMLGPKDPAFATGLDAKLIDSQLRPKLVRS